MYSSLPLLSSIPIPIPSRHAMLIHSSLPGNNIFQPGKEGSSEKGGGSGSGDRPETDADADANVKAKAKESGSASGAGGKTEAKT